jgi:hypothetical protein
MTYNLSFCRKILTLILVTLHISYASAKDIYVNRSNSSGTENGTFENGYISIQQAVDEAKPGDVIHIRAGEYREEVKIAQNGITIQAYKNDEVTINGTEVITNWQLHEGTTYITSQMDWDCAASDGGNQLFVDKKMINLVRWPKQTSADIVKPTDGIADAVNYSGNYIIITDNEFDEPDGRWDGAQAWINLSANGHDGEGVTIKVVTTNRAKKTITLDYGSKPYESGAWAFEKNSEFFLFNPTQAGVNSTGGIDAVLGAGEWWKNNDILYLKTPNGKTPSSNKMGENLVEAKMRLFAFIPKGPYNNHSITIRNLRLFSNSQQFGD